MIYGGARGFMKSEPTREQKIEAIERFIRDEKSYIASYRRKISDCQDRIQWALKVKKGLKEDGNTDE